MEAVSHLNADQVTADLNAVADYAGKIPASSGKCFVSGGFIFGEAGSRFGSPPTAAI